MRITLFKRLEYSLFLNIKYFKKFLEFPTENKKRISSVYENQKLFVKPTSIIDRIKVDYIRKPNNILWAFDVGGLGQYQNIAADSVDFELHESEQSEVILKVLLYAGIVIRDPQIVQAAVQQVQSDEINSKS